MKRGKRKSNKRPEEGLSATASVLTSCLSSFLGLCLASYTLRKPLLLLGDGIVGTCFHQVFRDGGKSGNPVIFDFLAPHPIFLEIGQGDEWGAFRILARSRSPMRRRNVIEIHSWFLLFPVHGRRGRGLLSYSISSSGQCRRALHNSDETAHPQAFYLQLFQ